MPSHSSCYSSTYTKDNGILCVPTVYTNDTPMFVYPFVEQFSVSSLHNVPHTIMQIKVGNRKSHCF